MSSDSPSSTLRPIELDPTEFLNVPPPELVRALLARLRPIKDARFTWYDNRRRRLSLWVNGTRRALAILGTIAVFLTAVAGLLRIYDENGSPHRFDIIALAGALLVYALMAR